MQVSASRCLWRCGPARGLAESWLLALLLLFSLSRLEGYVKPLVFGSGTLLLCGASGMWAVLRIRLPTGQVSRKLGWELSVAVLLSAIMSIGLLYPARLLGWEAIWTASGWGSGAVNAILLATGPGYLVARAGVRAWLMWDRMRRQRMRWSLTHALLTVVVVIAMAGALAVFLLTPYSRNAVALEKGLASPVASVVTRLIVTTFPAVSLIALLTVLALAVVLPPAALFSYLVARQITRRLETLAAAAEALRSGNLDARVAVVGEDELAGLQSDFNSMAANLGRTMSDLQTQRDTVSRLLQSRRELIAGVSHELRTPVATVRATLESALASWADVPPSSLHHDLEVMEGEVRRLQGLIDDLFTLSQTEAGGLALECRPTDVLPLVTRMVEAMAPLAWTSSRVEVVAELPGRLPLAHIDAARLEQVLANLLRNGVHHTPPGGIVAVMSAAQGDCVVIEVRDTGAGISAQDLPHIWDRFYRGGEQRSNANGAGLGLALVKELTEAMGGSVRVATSPGQGSCFTLTLPQA